MNTKEIFNRLIEIIEERAEVSAIQVHKPVVITHLSLLLHVPGKINNEQCRINLYGYSKVCYPDEWNVTKGMEIAKRRAIVWLIRDVLQEAKRKRRSIKRLIKDTEYLDYAIFDYALGHTVSENKLELI